MKQLVKGRKYWCEWKLYDRFGICTGRAGGSLEFTGEYDDLTGAARMKDNDGITDGFRMIPLKDIY